MTRLQITNTRPGNARSPRPALPAPVSAGGHPLEPRQRAIDLKPPQCGRYGPDRQWAERPLFGYLTLVGRTGSGQTAVQVLGESLPHCGCLPVSLVWLSHDMRLAEHRVRSG